LRKICLSLLYSRHKNIVSLEHVWCDVNELEKTQANIAYNEEKIKEGLADIRKKEVTNKF